MHNSANEWLQTPTHWLGAIAGLALLQIALIVTHRPHVDEYQAIQIAVQAPDLQTILAWLKYEGHPPLWYFLLRGLAYLFEPMAALKVAVLLCALVAQCALLFGSPFTRAERLLIASSEFLLFEYLTISRSLSLGAAAMIVTMALWQRRSVWIAIAILPMCDFLFGVISLAFVAMKVRERDVWLPGAVLWLVSGLLAAVSVIPAADAQPAIELVHPLVGLSRWTLMMGSLLVPFQGLAIPQWDTAPNFLVASWGGLAFLYFVWLETDRDKFFRAILMALAGVTLVFSVFVYQLSPRHLMLIAFMFIMLTWRMRAAGALPSPAFRLWLSVAAFCGLLIAAINFVWPFDTAYQAAEEIKRRNLQDKHWIVFTANRAQGISAMTGIDFERTELHCMQSLIRWNHHSKLKSIEQVTAHFRAEGKRHGRSYLLTEHDLDLVPRDVLEPVVSVPRGYDGLSFHIYIVAPGEKERDVELPPCVSGRRPFERLG